MSRDRAFQAKYYHALNLLPSLGPVRIKRLVQRFGTPEQVWQAVPRDLAGVEGFTAALREKISREWQKVDPVQAWEKIIQQGYSFIVWEDSRYPLLLREIYDPPPLLYYRGNIDILNNSCLAVVGSRRHTVYGRENAYKFAYGLSKHGLTIVSGMARGIDTWAHKGVFEARGKTAAILGCGLDICYPPENKAVKKNIENFGVLVSEFPPGYKPLPSNFPRRNRIISGLSLGTLVIEAGEKSGALITADFALEQGREVFAIPGGIASPYSRGCHKLIKEGAKLVEKIEDILEEISVTKSVKDVSPPQEKQDFSPEEKKLLQYIPFEPLALEELVVFSKMPPATLNALLLELELKGAIKQLPGKYFMKS
ncbi:MAG: DNA-protecting protein DprA [Firmicutes bacterium]|nr:DNA-protecting protein DprA [Bacillota bacterium]